MDAELRAAQRAVEESPGDQQALAAYVRLRLRRGERVPAFELQAVEPDPRERLRYLIAAREELPGSDTIEREYRATFDEINQRAVAALRNLHARIRRSKRTRFTELERWAIEVAGQDAVSEAVAHFQEERQAASERARQVYEDLRRRMNEIDLLKHQVAWEAVPRHGDLEALFRFSEADTFRSVGLGAESYARNSAEDYVIFLASQGFDSRLEHEPGTLHEQPYAQSHWDRSYRTGNGWRVFVQGVLEQLDVEILKLRYDGWTYPSSYFGHDVYMNMPTGRHRGFSDERYNILFRDPSLPGRRVSVERMKQIVAERGPLRPSWLMTTRPNPWGEPRWYYSSTEEALRYLEYAEPDASYVQVAEVGDDSQILEGRRVRWLVNSNYVVWIPADKILFMEGNSWNPSHARALLDLIKDGERPVFALPAARVHRIDQRELEATISEDAADELEYQRGMQKPWTPSDVGQLRAQLLDGNHRALAAIAAGEESIPVIVGENYRGNVMPEEWIGLS